MKITWKLDSVYVDGHHCGYIDPIGENGGYYGNVQCPTELSSMTHFGVIYGRQAIKKVITEFVKANYEKVLAESVRIENLNKK